MRRKEEFLKNREKQLRKEGVRRSQRLEKFHYAQIVNNINIPNFSEAHDNKNWQEAMEKELESLNTMYGI